MRKAGSMGFTETLLNYYNKKTRFGLEKAKLYKKQKNMDTERNGIRSGEETPEIQPSLETGKETGTEAAPA